MTEVYPLKNRFIGVPELSHRTSLKKTALYELVKKGELKPLKLGRKTVFLESEVIAWMESKLQSRNASTGGAK